MPRTSRGRSSGSMGCLAKLIALAIVALLAFLFIPSSWLGRGKKPSEEGASSASTDESDSAIEAKKTSTDAAEPSSATASKADAKATDAGKPAAAAKADERPSRAGCSVRDVINGQSFRAFVGDRLRTIRLLYIDAPRAGEPMYDDAKKALTSILADGEVSLEYVDGFERDRDGRVLAYVHAGGTHANVEMVCRGLAVAWRRGSGSSYETKLATAEQEAKDAERGIWGTWKVMTQDMKRHVAKSVASDGSSRVTLHDGRSVTMRNSISVRMVDVKRKELYEIFGFGEGDTILKEAGR